MFEFTICAVITLKLRYILCKVTTAELHRLISVSGELRKQCLSYLQGNGYKSERVKVQGVML